MHGQRSSHWHRDIPEAFEDDTNLEVFRRRAFRRPPVVIVTVTATVVVPPSKTPHPPPIRTAPTIKTTSTTHSTTHTTPTTSAVPTTTSTTSSTTTSTTTSDFALPVVTSSFDTPLAASTVSPSPPATPSATSSLNAGALVGGIAGSLIALAALAFLLLFCLRRRHKRRQDPDNFDPDLFKRQSMLLADGPASGPGNYGTAQGASKSRAPNMVQRMSTFVSSYGQRHPYSSQYAQSSEASSSPTYYEGSSHLSPKLVVASQPTPFFASTFSANSGTAMSFSPSGAPFPYASHYDQQQRQSDVQGPPSSTTLGRSNTLVKFLTRSNTLDASNYVDLDRSSITPFQAAQYAEISRRLNTEPPQALPPKTGAAGTSLQNVVEEELEGPSPSIDDFPPVPNHINHVLFAGSRSATPESTRGVPVRHPTPEAFQPTQGDDDEEEDGEAQFATFPPAIPPKDERIMSTPPILPEIHLHEASQGERDSARGFAYDEFPVSALANSFSIPSPSLRSSLDSSLATTAGPGAGKEVKPSPLREATTAASAVLTPTTATSSSMSSSSNGRPESTYSLYGADAYGGI